MLKTLLGEVAMRWVLLSVFLLLQLNRAFADDAFEKHIRPLLSDHCIKCHGAMKQSGGLRLDSQETILKGGKSGSAIVPRKPTSSLLIKAVSQVGELKMPPKGKLSSKQIEHLTNWIEGGAVWPDPTKVSQAGRIKDSEKHEPSDKQRSWWAYQPLNKKLLPKGKNQTWGHNEIDQYIFKELEKQSIKPLPTAGKEMLLRRASFDLTGLPPSPKEVEAFLRDESHGAFAKVIDRLLGSPAYGERWGRHWLDVVRYADYHDGNPKARNPVCEPLEAWRYRDWVVESFNADLPFDQFIKQQIAGDLLPALDGKKENFNGLIATTFLVNGAWDRGDADKEKMVSDMVDDQIDTIGKAFMGLTLGCARCHDHKYDPISQRDYYGLAGIFYSTRMLTELGTKGGEITLQRRPLVSKELLEKRALQISQIAGLTTKLLEHDKKMQKPKVEDPERKKLVEEKNLLQSSLIAEPAKALAVSEGGVPGGLFPKIQDVPIHIRGSYTRLGEVVPRAMPVFFAGEKQKKITEGSGRLELANWVAAKENPLTSRVIVNRVWQWHFGTGLVKTPNNLGLLSEPVSHPELLDFLATKFIEEGWSIKKLTRNIMLSATYQQSSLGSKAQASYDPENRWLGRFSAHRLEAEAIRDSMIFVTGRLDSSMGGSATHEINNNRRTLYFQTARWDRSDFATLFDAANPDATVEKRNISTVAPQALFMLNHDFVQTKAKQLAERVIQAIPEKGDARIRLLILLLFSRQTTEEDLIFARNILSLGTNYENNLNDLAHLLMCSNEFIYID